MRAVVVVSVDLAAIFVTVAVAVAVTSAVAGADCVGKRFSCVAATNTNYCCCI